MSQASWFETAAMTGALARSGENLEHIPTAFALPDNLPPHIRAALEAEINDGGWTAQVKNLVTNPLAITGALLAFGSGRWRTGSVKSQIQALKEIRGIDKPLGWVTRQIGSLRQILGEKVGNDVNEMAYYYDGLVASWMHPAEKAIETLNKTSKDMTLSQIKLMLRLEGAERAGSKFQLDHFRPAFGMKGAKGKVFANPINMTTEEEAVYQHLVTLRKRINEEVLEPLINNPDGQELLKRLSNSRGEQVKLSFRKLADYAPHQFSRRIDANRITTFKDADWMDLVSPDFAKFAKQGGKHVTDRRHRMLIDYDDLLKYPGLISQDGMAAINHPVNGLAIRRAKGAPVYSPKAVDVFRSYLHDMGRVSAWAIKSEARDAPYGRIMQEHYNTLKNSGDRLRQEYLGHTYIPVALGRMQTHQLAPTFNWITKKRKAYDWFGDDAKSGWLGKFVRDKSRSYLSEVGTWGEVTGQAAQWMYVGALGGNLSSATMNLLQNILTTYPHIGAEATAIGVKRTMQGVPAYFNARMAGKTKSAAIAQVFPQFAKSGLPGAPITSEATVGFLEDAWRSAQHGPGNRVKKALMSVFSTTEWANRLITFEGQYGRAVKQGLDHGTAMRWATEAVQTAQFAGGPLSAPGALIGKGPLSRQFLQFPMRYAGFLHEGARMGMPGALGGVGNPGRIGRALLGSTAAWHGGKALGLDLSKGLMWGALPEPHESAPFYPWPFVPPAWSLGGAAAEGLFTQDFSKLKYQLPILIPGGVAAARAASYTPYGKSLGRPYVAWDKPHPETGLFPVYTSGNKLKGYHSKKEIALMAAGINPTSKVEEAQMMAFMVKQRDNIGEMRRGKVQALLDNDSKTADDYDAQYKDMFGIDVLPIKKKDFELAKMKREVTRSERMLETMPAEQRSAYGENMSAAIIASQPQMLGINPSMLSDPVTPTIKSRRPAGHFRNNAMPEPQLDPAEDPLRQAMPAGPQVGFGGF